MKRQFSLLFSTTALLLLAAFFSCTPKTAEPLAEQDPTPPPAQDENLSPCPNWTQLPAGQMDEAETNYVLYRDFLKVGELTKAYNYWKKVYEVAPAADGKRNSVLVDGIYFYENLLRGETDETIRQQYIDLIFQLYDEMEQCFPEDADADARKAFDYFYKYPDQASKEEIFALFQKTVDAKEENTPYFVLNPFTSLLVELYGLEKVSFEDAQKYQRIISATLNKGLEECQGQACENWKIIESYVPARLEAFETEKGFFDCDYYKEKYWAEFEQNPQDCDVIRTVYSRLKWGDCPDTDEKFAQVIKAANDNCVEDSSLKLAYQALREARYKEAIDLFEKAGEEASDNDQKAKIQLIIAKIYYSHLKSYSSARQYARKAANLRDNWGEPYILIGTLYASSGPICGPGRGWDSQIVTWPAIDKWSYAKRIDPNVAEEAQRLINRYSQYMPSKEDIFQRQLKEGDSFRVRCWIQETTTIRAAPY
jgi:hypothetical protein